MDHSGGWKSEQLWAGLNRPDVEVPDISILGIPYDGAACYRAGAAEAPDRIRMLSAEIPPVLETGEILKALVVRDTGNLQWTGDFVAAHPLIQEEITRRVASSFVLTLGGDHSVSIPVFRAISHQADEKVALIYVDAHTDLSNRFRDSPYSNGCPLRRAMEEEQFSPDWTVLVGTRCFEIEALQFIQDRNMKVFPAHEIVERGMEAVACEIIKKFEGLSNVYLSIDIDALDPAFAPGTGIPDGGGLSTRDLMILIRALDSLPIISADLVEVSPPLDHSDITSFAALRIIMEIFGLVNRRRSLGKRITLR